MNFQATHFMTRGYVESMHGSGLSQPRILLARWGQGVLL